MLTGLLTLPALPTLMPNLMLPEAAELSSQ